MKSRGGPSMYAMAAARLLQRGRREAPASLPPDRRRLVAAVEHALAARARRRRAVKVWALSFAAAGAAVLVAGGALYRRAEPGRSAVVAGAGGGRAVFVLDDPGRNGAGAFLPGTQPMPLHRGMELPPGIRLAAPSEGEVQLGTGAGTVMTMETSTSLTVREADATQWFVLHGGAVRLHVAPLLTGERFLINTTDAEIEVHGTTFRVAVLAPDAACADRERTRVTVTEGVVSVRSRGDEVRLTPGSVWQSSCIVAEARSAPRADRATTERVTAARRRGVVGLAPAAEEPLATGALPPSVLAAQNDLFAAALRAKEQGRAAQAVALFDRLLTEHPRSPLCESAAAQRMKLLALRDRAGAGRAAADYLRRFPDGFARQEAQGLVDATSGDRGARPR